MSNAVDYKRIAFSNKRGKNISDFEENPLLDNSKKIKAELMEEIHHLIASDYKDLIDEILLGKKDRTILENIIDDFININSIDIGMKDKNLVKSMVDVMVGWERLQPLIEDPEITNIFTNEDLEVLKRVRGKDIITNIKFDTDEELEQFIKNMAIRTGEKINRDKCTMEGVDKVSHIRIQAGIYGSQVRKGEVVRKPFFALRKFPASNFGEKDFIDNETFNEDILKFYDEILEFATIVVVGAPDAGKTTHLDFLQSRKDPMRRVIRIEEDAESSFKSKNSVSFEVRKISSEDKRHKYDMATFTKLATRLAGKDVFVGEARDEEAWFLYRLIDMGYLAVYSVHGKSCRGGLEQTVFLMSLADHNLTYTQLMSKVCDSVDIVVYMDQRKVVDIAEVKGYDFEKAEPILNYIFRLNIDENGNFYWEKGSLSDNFKEGLELRKKLKERSV